MCGRFTVKMTLAEIVALSRTDHWLKVKNPAAPAVRPEAEEEWRK